MLCSRMLLHLLILLVFDRPGKEGVLQIIDFGSSVNVADPNKVYNDAVGTIHYMPPESQRSRKGEDLKKSDLWCDYLGVSQYLLIYHCDPCF